MRDLIGRVPGWLIRLLSVPVMALAAELIFQVPFGNPTMQDTITLSAPTGSMTSVQLVNTSGNTVVRISATGNGSAPKPATSPLTTTKEA